MSKIEIIPLGTVSPYPKDNMNCPGFMVKYNDKKILLDCGNGITRFLNLPDDLKDLSVIITHYHKDHCADVEAIQYASCVYHKLGLINDNVCIYLPKNDHRFCRESIVSAKEAYVKYIDIDDNFYFFVDDLKITFEDNKSHSIESYMVKLENADLKIVYTSDIGITNFEKLVDFCKNADLIVCESTFLKKHNSSIKTHMRAYDAGVLANKAKAKMLLLTHFWPEEDKKLYLEEAKEVYNNVEIAEENKKIVLGSDLCEK